MKEIVTPVFDSSLRPIGEIWFTGVRFRGVHRESGKRVFASSYLGARAKVRSIERKMT